MMFPYGDACRSENCAFFAGRSAKGGVCIRCVSIASRFLFVHDAAFYCISAALDCGALDCIAFPCFYCITLHNIECAGGR